MGEIDQSYDPNAKDVDSEEEAFEIDETSAPKGMRLQEVRGRGWLGWGNARVARE